MPTSNEWPIFLGAVFVYAAAPGPALLYVLVRSLNGGRRYGTYSALGNSIGTAAHVIAAAIGLSAVVANSSSAYTAVKFAGAAYLAYLGIQACRGDRTTSSSDAGMSRRLRVGTRSPLAQGVIVETLNPSTALFFIALLPQFIHPEHTEPRAAIVALGFVVVIVALAIDMTIVLSASRLHAKLSTNSRWLERPRVVTGALFIGLGTFVALT